MKIMHRVNDLDKLSEVTKTDINYGAEIDLRYHENDIILHHDPFHHHEKEALKFEDFLKNYTLKGPLILNIKSEGIEQKSIELLKKYSIESWFFLDLSMPCFAKFSYDDLPADNLAVRFSEREPIEYALSFAGRAKWVWVDCFTKLPLCQQTYKKLKADFKLCIVSPELQGHSLERIEEFKSEMSGMEIDAVCTKRPDLW